MTLNRNLYMAWRSAGMVIVIGMVLCASRGAYCQQAASPLQAALGLLEGGKVAEAKTLLDNYLKENSSSAEAHFLLGYVLFREKMAKESLDQFTAGAQIERPSTSDLKVVAADYVLLGDFSDADKWLTMVVTSSPQDPDAWYLLGRTKYNENRFAEAIDSFNHTLALRPHDVKAEDNLGLSYEGLNESEKARSAFQTAIAWQENASVQDAQPFLNLGALLLRENQTARAVSCLTQAVKAAPDNPKAHEELSRAYSEQNDLPQAQKELEIAITLAPNASSLHYKLGRLYHRLGFPTEAQREFDVCAELLSTHSSIDTPNPPSSK